ncbi:MAG: pilus assembly protein [Sphingomonadales bacterium]|nr:pilus assembly protein [Sphingomonadales bacterium]MBD3774761.1 pilus assembly protein [Paracoccaceae bacterium]
MRLIPKRPARAAQRIARDLSGVAAVEFAMILPLFVTLGLVGTEVAYMATVNMQVSQIALSLADNASRLGQTDNSAVTPTVTETDIDSVMSGALTQGNSIDLGTKGRIILSSLEYDDSTGKQYIHWQRCRGTLARNSAYGDDDRNNGLGSTPIAGVGSSTTKITAASGSAVMVAEIYYDYDGIFSNFLPSTPVFRQEAIFAIRDDRNLTPGVTGGGGHSDCG